MYNRYIPTEEGVYTRVTEEESPRQADRTGSVPPPGGGAPAGGSAPLGGDARSVPLPPFSGADGIAAFLRRTLDQLHLDRIDTGDLLLLGLLYFLFREKADEELLAALGLLLIL